jgi:arylsulfatase A-like enzyme
VRRRWGLLAVGVLGLIVAPMLAPGRAAQSKHSAVGVAIVDPDVAGISPTTAPAQRPNIVFVMVDDLDTELVDHMPNLQALVRDKGASFDDYFVTSALCCPSRSSFLRGQYPHNTTVLTNEDGFSKFHALGLEKSTVATWLQTAGYRSALMGKYLNGYLEAPGTGLFDYVPPGWNEWDVAGDGFREVDYTLNHNGTLEAHGAAPQDFLTDVLTTRATSFIADNAAAGRPFFLELSTFAPHFPYTSPARYAADFTAAQAPRPASFDVAGTAEPAWLAGLPLLTAAQIADIDVAYQKRLRAVQGIDAMAANVDLAPTFAAWAGADVPSFVDGRALQPLLGGATPANWRNAVLVEHTGPPTLPGDPDYQLTDNPTSYVALRTVTHLYVSYANGDEELYDRAVDPDELHNVRSSANATVLAGLRATLLALRSCQAQQCRVLDRS